jgi:vacuolar-type H+-ATPase subunit I/STV1
MLVQKGGGEMNWKLWLKGLISAVIGAAANSITIMIVDPVNFNLAQNASKVGWVAIVSAIVAAAMYLKASPLPNGTIK